MPDERRVYTRYTVWFPVTLDVETQQIYAVCRDASPKGILISASTPLSLGATVTATFRVAREDNVERQVLGRIVRIEPTDDDNPRTAWPHRMAVEFDEPIPDIDAPLKRASTRPPPKI